LLITFQPMKKTVYILMMSLMAISVCAQKESDDVRNGNKLYKSSKFTEAEIAYRKGLINLVMHYSDRKNIKKHWNNITMLLYFNPKKKKK